MKKSKYADKMVDLVEDYLQEKGVSPDFTIEELLSDEDYFAIRLEHDASGHLFTYELQTLYDAHESEDVKVKDQFKDYIKNSIKTFIENNRSLTHTQNNENRHDFDEDYEDDFDEEEDYDDFDDDFDEDDEYDDEEEDYDDFDDEDVTEAEYGEEIRNEQSRYENLPPRELFLSLSDHDKDLMIKWNYSTLTETEEAELYQKITFEQAMSMARECGDLLTISNEQEDDFDEVQDFENIDLLQDIQSDTMQDPLAVSLYQSLSVREKDLLYKYAANISFPEEEKELFERITPNQAHMLIKAYHLYRNFPVPVNTNYFLNVENKQVVDKFPNAARLRINGTDMVAVIYDAERNKYLEADALHLDTFDQAVRDLMIRSNYTVKTVNIPEILRTAAGIEEYYNDFLFVENIDGSSVSGHLLNHHLFKDMSIRLGDFYVVPSTIHTLVFVKKSDKIDIDTLYGILNKTIENESSDLLLSKEIYSYDFESNQLVKEEPKELAKENDNNDREDFE